MWKNSDRRQNKFMEIEFENVSCNLCHHEDAETYLLREDLNVYIPGLFRLVRCKHCGLIYENPRPSINSWDIIYPEEYDQYEERPNPSRFRRFMRSYGLLKQIRSIEHFQKGGKLLDIGCATGEFLQETSRRPGWQVYGVEPGEKPSAIARSRGLDVFTGFLEEDPFPGIQFEVVTLWNVIEHLPDPLAALKSIYQRLQPGGWLVFSTPNLNSFDARIYQKYWIGYELPRHYYVFSEDSIAKLLDLSGFKLVAKKCLYGSFALSMSSLRFWLRAKQPGFAPHLEKLIFSLPNHILLSPYFFLTDKLTRSSPLTVFAQKT